MFAATGGVSLTVGVNSGLLGGPSLPSAAALADADEYLEAAPEIGAEVAVCATPSLPVPLSSDRRSRACWNIECVVGVSQPITV